MNKVYCRNCKYLWGINHCSHFSNKHIKDEWDAKYTKFKETAQTINKYNNCRNFKKPFGSGKLGQSLERIAWGVCLCLPILAVICLITIN